MCHSLFIFALNFCAYILRLKLQKKGTMDVFDLFNDFPDVPFTIVVIFAGREHIYWSFVKTNLKGFIIYFYNNILQDFLYKFLFLCLLVFRELRLAKKYENENFSSLKIFRSCAYRE